MHANCASTGVMKSGVNAGMPCDIMPMPCDIMPMPCDCMPSPEPTGWLGTPGSCESCDCEPGGAPGVPSTRIWLIARLMPPGVLKDNTERCFRRSPTGAFGLLLIAGHRARGRVRGTQVCPGIIREPTDEGSAAV